MSARIDFPQVIPTIKGLSNPRALKAVTGVCVQVAHPRTVLRKGLEDPPPTLDYRNIWAGDSRRRVRRLSLARLRRHIVPLAHLTFERKIIACKALQLTHQNDATEKVPTSTSRPRRSKCEWGLRSTARLNKKQGGPVFNCNSIVLDATNSNTYCYDSYANLSILQMLHCVTSSSAIFVKLLIVNR